MGPMEDNREDDVGSIRGGSIHPDVANMDTMLPPIRDYGRPSAITPPVIRRPAKRSGHLSSKIQVASQSHVLLGTQYLKEPCVI